jgi:hypothetical protein
MLVKNFLYNYKYNSNFIHLKMRKFFLIFSLLYIFLSSTSFPREIVNYSILIEEDFDSAMFIYRGQNSQITGEIFDYENYEFFGKTYKNKASETISFVQPASIKISGDRLSYQRKEYKLNNFEYNYTFNNAGLSFLTFTVPVEMNNYINKNIPFSISTLSKTAWYAGTFTLVENDDDLKVILSKNPEVFCKIILNTKKIYKTIKEFKKSELSQFGKKC